MTVAIISVLDRDGQARQSVPVTTWPVTIGRSLGCDVILDDPYVAAEHASIREAENGLVLEVGDTVNGAEVGGALVKRGGTAVLPPGAIVQLGTTRLRVRRLAESLDPERTLVPEPPAGRVPLPLILGALLTWTFADLWVARDPGSRYTDAVALLLSIVVALAIWSGLWALVTKLFRHRFEFWPHVRVVTTYLLASEAAGLMLPLLAFMFGIAAFSRVSEFATGALLCAMIAAHLARIIPARRKLIAGLATGLFLGGSALTLWFTYQTQERYFGQLYVSTLAPPAFRLVSPVPSAQFLEEARALKDRLDANARDDRFGSEDAPPWEMQHAPVGRR
jgi:pSer/pThr/pTyr-binding forkhead associated (FHA) protein